MPKPPKKKRSRSEVAEERVRVSEVMLREAALAYADVAKLDSSDPRWRRAHPRLRPKPRGAGRRTWRALHAQKVRPATHQGRLDVRRAITHLPLNQGPEIRM